MEITYNLSYDYAALALILLEIVYVRIQYSHDKYSNRLFIFLLHSSFLLTIVDVVSSLLLSNYAGVAPKFVVRAVSNLYFLSNAFVFLIFYRYIVEYLGDVREKTVGYYVGTYFPFCFIAECLIANHYSNILFTSGKYGHYSYGSLIMIIYLYPVYYFILTICSLVRSRKKVNAKQVFSVVSFMVITIIAVVVQLLFPEIMMVSLGNAISLLIMILTLETPDYKNYIKAQESLEAAREELEQRDDFNRMFVEEISREISKSIGRLLQMNESYPMDEMDDRQKEIYEYVEGYGRQIYSTINNAVELNLFGGKPIELNLREYSTRNMVADVYKVLNPLVKDTGNTLMADVGSNVPETLCGDENILKQILINFVSFANKNTKDGTISITVNCRQIDNDNTNLVVTVDDTGTGMKRDEVKKLLHFNTKGRTWKKEVFEGGDLKIKLTKRLIEKMNGKLSIDSAVGKGSVFTAVIPQVISKKE